MSIEGANRTGHAGITNYSHCVDAGRSSLWGLLLAGSLRRSRAPSLSSNNGTQGTQEATIYPNPEVRWESGCSWRLVSPNTSRRTISASISRCPRAIRWWRRYKPPQARYRDRLPGSPSTAAPATLSPSSKACRARGNRTYADFTTRSPIPRLINGFDHTPRNAEVMVGSFQVRAGANFLHSDGEFNRRRSDLVESTLTGRNFGWSPDQQSAGDRPHRARGPRR